MDVCLYLKFLLCSIGATIEQLCFFELKKEHLAYLDLSVYTDDSHIDHQNEEGIFLPDDYDTNQ